MKLLSMTAVCELTSLSRTAINRHRASGNFPEAVKVSVDRIAFVQSEVERWIADRIAARDQGEAA